MPTLAELCGLDIDETRLDGRSLVPVLNSAEAVSPHEGAAVHWQVGSGAKAQWAVREGDWKLMGNPRADNVEKTALWLSDLENDVGEQVNAAGANPDVVERLKAEHERWLSTLE